jgi:iron(III) transport system substrate-binding protein
VVTSVAQAEGAPAALAWLKAIKGNASAHIEPDNETVTADVNSGQAAIGLVDHYYWYRLAKEVGTGGVHSQIAYFAPHDPGYVEDISGVGILKSSKHKAAAEKLVEFMTSAAGQKVLAEGDSFEYPIHPGVAANAQLTPLSKLQPTAFTPAELGSGLNAKELLEEAGLI